jgi:hypothetical protein
MNWKCIIVGAIVFFVVTNILGMFVSGPIIHEGILDAAYTANESFWRPELTLDPPDMAALMPMWLLNGFIVSLIVAWLYCCFRRCLRGAEWKRGMKFCLCLSIFGTGMILAWSGVFNLPSKIWLWWAIDGLVIYALGGIALGWAVGKWGGVEEARAA